LYDPHVILRVYCSIC